MELDDFGFFFVFGDWSERSCSSLVIDLIRQFFFVFYPFVQVWFGILNFFFKCI